jgi:hypothetical protein
LSFSRKETLHQKSQSAPKNQDLDYRKIAAAIYCRLLAPVPMRIN